MNFTIAGPFEISRHGTRKMITDESMKELKAKIEDDEAGLSRARGCYVFVIKAGKGFTPYYVGQACKQSIVREALNPSNREKYNKIEGKGTPMMFVLPMLTSKGRYGKKGKTGSGSTDFLERWLIAAAINKNPQLRNNKQTSLLRKIHVVGLLNPRKRGETTEASRLLKKALDLP